MDCYLFKWDTKRCCDECHEDYEQYGYQCCELKIEGKYYSVCCGLRAAWNDKEKIDLK